MFVYIYNNMRKDNYIILYLQNTWKALAVDVQQKYRWMTTVLSKCCL